jgi:hypothetical protein
MSSSIIRFLLFCCSLSFFSCFNSTQKNKSTQNDTLSADSLSFKEVNGIRFFEVKRRFKNGLSFNENGFQQEPNWIIEVKHPDTMLAYSPEKKAMEAFYLQFDHGTVYNFAREFFRLKAITKDSMVLQRLQVDGKIIANDDDIRSDVYCTFYSKNYIENVLKTTIGELQKPSKADSLFIRSLSAKTNNAPSNPDLAFAARQPVQFLPNSKNVTVEKISTVDAVNKRHSSVDYLYPLYKLKINKSYKNFNYSFSVIVDAWGKMYVNRVDGVMRDDYPPRKRLLQGITDVYLQNLFIIKPGTTLGIPHSSEVSLILIGKTNP